MIKVFDLHNDLPTLHLHTGTCGESQIYESYGINRVVSAFWTTQIKNPLLYITDYIRRFPVTQNRLYAIEDLHFIQDEAVLESVLKLPLAYAGLTWNGDNILGGGAGSLNGLTETGKKVIKKLSAHGIVPDTAHLSEKSFYGVADSCEVFINSHTCLKSIFEHERNLNDSQINLLLSRGGIVGLTLVAQFAGKPEKQGKRADYVRQIDTFVQKFGVGGLSVGTDFNGTDPFEGLSCYEDFGLLAADLKKAGYRDNDIEKIFFHNANDFFLARGRFVDGGLNGG